METKVYTNSAVNADFIYDDTDDYQNEIAEFYSYSEEKDLQQNFIDFQIEIKSLGLSPLEWRNWDQSIRYNFIMKIVDQLENSNDMLRMRATRCVLYLTQGCWAEVKSIEEQQELTRHNVLLLYKNGVFQSMINLLNMELQKASQKGKFDEVPPNISNTISLKIVFNVLYILVETIRYEQLKKNPDYSDIIEECVGEISTPLADGILLPTKLFGMITKFCDGTCPHFPIKKILLLLWKSSLLVLGNSEQLHCLQNELRVKFNLLPFDNDTVNVSKQMPASIISREDSSMPKRSSNPNKRNRGLWEVICENTDVSRKQISGTKRSKRPGWSTDDEPTEVPEVAMKYETISKSLIQSTQNSLLFEPKVRLKDIEVFIQNARLKYFGYNLKEDTETLVGLPFPVQESVLALKRHLYISLSEMQLKEEEKQCKFPYKNEIIELRPVELLYQELLPNFRKYITDLLRILLASSPSSKLSMGSLNTRIVGDILPKNPSSAAIFSTSIQTDVIRHKEIVVKAITAILLLYLKHFKVNHINQFEYMSQLLAQCSFIKLALQVFVPIMPEYVAFRTAIPRREFPLCVLDQFHEDYTNEHIYVKSATELTYTWRNLFSCINIMRILNKLVKWKNSRILNMVSFKSTGALKEVLQIRQPLLQVYVLKLLKIQARYLGRYWRRNNLKVMTAIYTKVRHRFNDDWAYGCDTVAKFWNAQEEEFELRTRVIRFHNRHYPDIPLDCDFVYANANDKGFKITKGPTAEGGISTRAKKSKTSNSKTPPDQSRNFLFSEGSANESSGEEQLTEYFKKNYEEWLNNQVFSHNFDWDSV